MRQHELSNGTTAWDAASITDKYRESIGYDGNGNILTFLRNGTTEDNKPLNMDNLAYGYTKDSNGMLLNNRLRHVKDSVSSANYTEDLDDQADDNYQYDAIGNLVKDTQEGIDSVSWTVYGKIKSISKSNGTSILYHYDPNGNRVSKMVNGLMTWYIRDAQGNTMGVYDNWNCGITGKIALKLTSPTAERFGKDCNPFHFSIFRSSTQVTFNPQPYLCICKNLSTLK